MDLKNLFEAAQKVQAEMVRVKQELETKTVEGESGGGLVRCLANGKGDLVSLTLDPSLLNAPDADSKRMVEDLVTAAVNQSLQRARALAEKEVGKVAGGLAIPPGLMGG